MNTIENYNTSEELDNKITIPQISKALEDLFAWNEIESKEMTDSIRKLYDLIWRICNLSDGLKNQLLLWATNAAFFPGFIQNIRSQYWMNNDIIDEYEDFFTGWNFDDNIKSRRKILWKYNPSRLTNLK